MKKRKMSAERKREIADAIEVLVALVIAGAIGAAFLITQGHL